MSSLSSFKVTYLSFNFLLIIQFLNKIYKISEILRMYLTQSTSQNSKYFPFHPKYWTRNKVKKIIPDLPSSPTEPLRTSPPRSLREGKGSVVPAGGPACAVLCLTSRSSTRPEVTKFIAGVPSITLSTRSASCRNSPLSPKTHPNEIRNNRPLPSRHAQGN